MTPPSSAVQALLAAHLPTGVRVVGVRGESGVLVATLADEHNAEWALEWWEGRPERRSFRDGSVLRFAYRSGSASPSEGEVRRVLDAIAAAEAELASLPPPSRALPAVEGRVAFFDETRLLGAIAAVLPRAGSVARAIERVLDDERAKGPIGQLHFYLQARCEQACEFCEEPKRRERPLGRLSALGLRAQSRLSLDLVSSGAIEVMLAWLKARAEPAIFQLTGHDWLGHRHLDRILVALESNPGVPLRLQGPSYRLESAALARRVAALPHLELVTTTLQSSDPAEHDAMVGLPGAHVRLSRALEQLGALGVRVELAVVLTRRALRTLPETLASLAGRGTSARLHAFVPDRGMGDAGPALAPLDEIRTALERVEPTAVRAIVGVPPCAVPAHLAEKLVPGVDGAVREPAVYASVCATCTARARCPGVPAPYLVAHGERGFRPETG